jgi:hypothetical protein
VARINPAAIIAILNLDRIGFLPIVSSTVIRVAVMNNHQNAPGRLGVGDPVTADLSVNAIAGGKSIGDGSDFVN